MIDSWENTVLFPALAAWSEAVYPQADTADWDDVGWDEVRYQTQWLDLGEFSFRTVHDYGGEGEGTAYGFVFEVFAVDSVQHYKVSGYWVSHDGGYYESFRKVTPKQEVVTVWA